MSTLLMSDLHLPAQASPLRRTFITFLGRQARDAQNVYLLGDLFETWIGDAIGMRIYAEEIAAIAALTTSGVAVFIQHGNRDFLLGNDFRRASGAMLLDDPVVVELQGRRTLLTHGDWLCSDDVGYQRWRRFSRNKLAQRLFLQMPGGWRTRIAVGVRSGSRKAKQDKSVTIMDVNEAAVAAAFRAYDVDRIIHGHTHRPAEHHQVIDGRERQRIVLADWRDDRCEVLEVTPTRFRRLKLSD